MQYSILAESFEKMESTRKRLELTQYLVELFEKTPHDVAWSFMKQYKQTYPLHNFALVSDLGNSDKPTIFRYI